MNGIALALLMACYNNPDIVERSYKEAMIEMGHEIVEEHIEIAVNAECGRLLRKYGVTVMFLHPSKEI